MRAAAAEPVRPLSAGACARGRRGGCRCRCRLAFALGLASLRARALHVDAAAEVRAFGNRDARRRDVAVDRAVVADVDLLARGHVAGDLAEDDHGLGEYLRLDAGVGPDREDVLPQLDLPLDLSLDREVLASAQLTLDYDGF